MIMYIISLLLIVLSVLMDESISTIKPDLNSRECDHIFRLRNVTRGMGHLGLPHCSDKDIPNKVDFNVVNISADSSDFGQHIKVKFKPPMKQCMYGVTLVMIRAIKDEDECATAALRDEDIFSIKHNQFQTICHYMSDVYDESFILYEDEIELLYTYSSSGCHAFLFSNFDDNLYVTDNVYLY